MAITNVWDNDAFGMVSLSASLAKAPFVPGQIGATGLFKSVGITTTTAIVEEKHGTLALVPNQARGSQENTIGDTPRVARPFRVPHLPLNETVLAEAAQGVRQFGSETAVQTVSGLVNDKLETIRQNFETTWEYHRIGAINGTVLDADGTTVLHNYFTEFSITRTDVSFDFTSVLTDYVKTKATEAIRAIEVALGLTPFTGVVALCGDSFFDKLTSHVSVTDAFARKDDGRFLREQQFRGGFVFAGIEWMNYRGSIAGTPFIPTDKARIYPVGVPDLFIQNNAPADMDDTVNTVGREMYAIQERLRFNKGTEIHAQSNPLFIATRPQALINGEDANP